MKKRLFGIFAGVLLTFSLCSCGTTTVNVNVENQEELNNTILGKTALIEIGNGLYYDSSTRNVYWWNGVLDGSYGSIAPTAYYAPNGLPYRYNPETNTFEPNPR